MKIRKSTVEDLPRILAIYERARKFMAETGNPRQWGGSWPPADLIPKDIEAGESYVCEHEGRPVAVFLLRVGEDIDPTYRLIDGAWIADGPYGVVHRIASSGEVKGAGAFCLDWAFEQCRHLRIDTFRENRVMRELLAKKGFSYRGVIALDDGSPRMAFEKIDEHEAAHGCAAASGCPGGVPAAYGSPGAGVPAAFSSLPDALAAVCGPGVTVTGERRVSGGDINEARRLTLSDGTALFMKSNAFSRLPMFLCERAGLAAIARTGAIGTPRVLAAGTDRDRNCSFLLMEHLEGGPRGEDYWEAFGHELAALHRADAADLTPGGRFGFYQDNVIGSGTQVNTPSDSWVRFFRDCRLAPKAEKIAGYFSAEDRKKLERLLERLDEYLTEPEQPSLLHGDLWGGNFMDGPDGRAWLIDPAAYVGHAEADLAMTELFGGFSPRFYAAYREAGLLQPGYGERRDLYNLYHLLNHLDLFGTGYLGSVLRVIRAYA